MSTKVVDMNIPMPWGHISARAFGDEQSEPVLCVHGREDNLDTFAYLIPLLPRNFYYVCIDLPGHGKSTCADKGYILGYEFHVLCVKRIINHFNWSKLYFLGHSYGGNVGFYLSAMYPELVIKLIVIDQTIMNRYLSPSNIVQFLRYELLDSTLKLEKRNSLEQAPTYSLEEFVEKMKTARGTELSVDQVRTIVKRNLLKVGPNQYKYTNDQRCKMMHTMRFTPGELEAFASKISCPTLVILGKHSLLTMSSVKTTPLQKNTNVVIRVLEGDHDLHIAHPQQVAKVIVPFLLGEIVSKL